MNLNYRGELKRKVKNYHNTQVNDRNIDVEIVTLKQYAIEQQFEQAWSRITNSNINQLDNIAKRIQYEPIKEFVEIINTNKILIGIHCDVVDNDAITKAMNFLISVDDLASGTKYNFGDYVNL